MPIPEDYPYTGACSFEDAMTIDDILLGTTVARNPRLQPTMAVPWPHKTSLRTSRSTGEIEAYERYPTGLITRKKLGPAPVRIKIYIDIGMIAIDRDIKTSCLWRTKFCARHCYNRALIRVRPNLKKSGAIDEAFWDALDGEWLHDLLHSEPFEAFAETMGKTSAFMRGRLRLATRGEAFAEPTDVFKVADLCVQNPQTTFWATTRCWTDNEMAALVKKHVMTQPNARILASLDPSHTPAQYDRIKRLRWNTIFFGDDTFTEGRFLCPKTWEKKISYCRICKGGCFKDGPVHVHLAVHGTRIEERELYKFRAR